MKTTASRVSSSQRSGLHRHAPALFFLALLAALPIAPELISSTTVLSEKSTDITLHFLYSRAFGFREMAHGNLPLWNPYIYGGIPFLGQFQSALLYPLNLLFLILPLAAAINWSFALHIFILGAGTYAWTFHRGLRPAAACVSGAAAMFSGTFFFHIYAGHLSNVCTMAWVPWVFLGIDRWLARRHAGWIFLSAGAVAMQIYAGHPQYVYYTAVMAGLYSLVHLAGVHRLPLAAGGLLAIYPLAALLAAAQLLPGIRAAGESVRSGGVQYEFAAMFSFPPENFFTLLVPWFFGGRGESAYWGRCYLWEMCAYAGTGLLLLAACGMSQKAGRSTRTRLLLVFGTAIVLAMGSHTPLHPLLFEILPGFSAFRGSSKFVFFAGLFLAVFAGMGANRLLRGEKPSLTLALAGGLLGLSLLGTGIVLARADGLPFFQNLVATVFQSGESYLPPDIVQNTEFLRVVHQSGSRALVTAGIVWMIFAGLFLPARRWQPAGHILIFAAVLELAWFARTTVASFPLKDFKYQPVTEFLQENPGDFRTLNLFNPDASMLLRSENVWGYDPSVLKRYAQLLHFSQGLDPEKAGQYLSFRGPHPILALLRCRLALLPDPAKGGITIQPVAEPFPRFFLVSEYEVIPTRGEIFQRLGDPSFDFKKQVILEEEPIPRPERGRAEYGVRLLSSSTDHWTIEVQTDKAALLIMTDSYSRDWRANPLPGSVQTSYTLLPANWAIRAIPLAAGHHQLEIQYKPAGFKPGLLISLASLVGLVTFLVRPAWRRKLEFPPR